MLMLSRFQKKCESYLKSRLKKCDKQQKSRLKKCNKGLKTRLKKCNTTNNSIDFAILKNLEIAKYL